MNDPENTAGDLTVEHVEQQIRDAEDLHSSLTDRLSRTAQTGSTNQPSTTNQASTKD
ncbi:hypothetical protein [Nesterenkonia haasae]|uniref:hypothetical protein n=1 Tax=Nesterenkonia haasae TaxID=2587813 RepID=UPI0012922888|nr:hypothetical protein [Nesterenkonia haasae]